MNGRERPFISNVRFRQCVEGLVTQGLVFNILFGKMFVVSQHLYLTFRGYNKQMKSPEVIEKVR